MKMKVIRALLWMIRTFKFSLAWGDGVAIMVYDWGTDRGKLVDCFLTPSPRGCDAYDVCCVLRKEGFLFLVWTILARSSLTTGYWRRTFNTYREDQNQEWPSFVSCRCHCGISDLRGLQ